VLLDWTLMSDIASQNAAAYAARHQMVLVEQLGFGIHGTVHVAQLGSKPQQRAIKAFRSEDFYHRERSVYERLTEAGVSEVLGFHVPQVICYDRELMVIEMTIVTAPFVLDFAGAFLDARPQFSDEIWADWEAAKSDQFGPRWKTVQAVMDVFEGWGVYLVDVSPSNIRFLEEA
jgi:hypothetical protein